MKRELHQNVKVLPYASGEAVDRNGYLSVVPQQPEPWCLHDNLL